jgi:hypothetical protein
MISDRMVRSLPAHTFEKTELIIIFSRLDQLEVFTKKD